MKKKTFFEFYEFLTVEHNKIHKNGGKKGQPVICKLVLAVTYWREYRPMRQMGLDYDVPKSTVCDAIKWVEVTLSKWDKIILEDIKTEIQKTKTLGIEVNEVIGDVEEQPIERPTIEQEKSYSGKKKRHTTKNQIIITENGDRILNCYNSVGTKHDFQMLKDSNVINSLNELKIGGKFDSAYQGIQKLLSNSKIPYKKSKNHELTDNEKQYNKELSKKRVKIEHANRELKIFRIMKETYRNHMNRYDTKLLIMCGIYNMNHSR